eukprot:2900825-Pleurochrysis_carterae.AAC.1
MPPSNPASSQFRQFLVLKLPLSSTSQSPRELQVKVYGARLDSTVAGFDNDITSERADEDHQIAFKDGVSLMQSGNYK